MTTTGGGSVDVRPVVSAEELVRLQGLVRRIPVSPSLVSFCVALVRGTRPDDPDAAAVTRRYVSWGAGPRASQYLVLGAKARAAARGDAMPTYDDVRTVAPLVLAHRVVPNFQAEADGRTPRDLVNELIGEFASWS